MAGQEAGPSNAVPTRGTVLLVEEEQNVRALLGKYLAEQGYAILEAKNSDEALRQCKGHKTSPISLMICDLLMTEMNGVELAGRARSYHPRMKTLYLSAHSESSMLFRSSSANGKKLPRLLKRYLRRRDRWQMTGREAEAATCAERAYFDLAFRRRRAADEQDSVQSRQQARERERLRAGATERRRPG